MLLASFSRIIKFNCQKLYLKQVEIISINSSVRVGMWMIQNTFFRHIKQTTHCWLTMSVFFLSGLQNITNFHAGENWLQ